MSEFLADDAWWILGVAAVCLIMAVFVYWYANRQDRYLDEELRRLREGEKRDDAGNSGA